MKKEIILVVLILIIASSLIIYFSQSKTSFTEEITSDEEQIISCSSSLSFSLAGSGTCNLTASISTENCENKKYEIKNNDAICLGEIKSDQEMIFCNWQVQPGNYTYNLYIGDELKDSRNIVCSQSITEPVCPNT